VTLLVSSLGNIGLQEGAQRLEQLIVLAIHRKLGRDLSMVIE
jgi:hypothetical protein